MPLTSSYAEMTNYEGRPVQLFDFNRGTIHWRYARADQDIMFRGQLYVALSGISDSGAKQNPEAGDNDMSITVPADSDIAQLYVSNTPSDRMYVTIWVYDLEAGPTDVGRMYWKGSVAGKAGGDNGSALLNCQDLAVGFMRNGLRLAWEKCCPNTLYDHECKVDNTLYAVAGALVSATGNTLTATILDSFEDGWFAGGYCEWEIATGIFQRRGIESHTGASVVVIGGVSTLAATDAVTFYPGCAHTIAVCNTKFNNHPNFGGVEYMRGSSPFDGSPVFT
jgi:uncharacterized phage protein (TIGR02218 family)